MARLIGAVVALLIAVPASAQRLGGGGTVDVSITRIVMALVLCLMIAGLAIFAIRRSGGRIDLASVRRRVIARQSSTRRIDVIETRRVSQYADVCLLRCDGQEYLILCAQHQQTVLRKGAAKSFAAALDAEGDA